MIFSLKNTGFVVAIVFMVFSCNSYSNNSAVVARIGNHLLYESDIENLVPIGTSHSDSIAMLQKYINTWALKYLLITKAEKEMPNIKNEISKEVEDYKNSLIAYKFERLYINQRLDTVVNETESYQYYTENRSDLVLKNPVVKSRVIKISPSSPNLARIRSMYRAEDISSIEELEQICYNSADKYQNFNNQWVDISLVTRELPANNINFKEYFKLRNYIELQDSLYSYLAFFYEIIPADGIAPLEFYQRRIAEAIIGKRKQELMSKLEKDLITEAIENNIIVTTINQEANRP